MFHKIKTNIKSILFSNQCKKSIFFMLISFLIFIFWLDTTFAVEAWVSDESKLITDLLSAMQYIAWIAWAIIGWLTAVISILLDPSWVNWTLFNITTYIKDVWIFVSNVVYLIFAWLLIAISFMNIIWKWNWDIFELKKSLPRFIIWVLIVPFSWFIVQFVISMASILTVSVYAWPIETFEPRLSNIQWEIEWCENRVMDIQWSLSSSNNDAEKNDLVYDDVWGSSTSKWFFYCKTWKVQKKIKDILFMKKDWVYNIWWIIWIYTFWIMDVWSLDKFADKTLVNIKTVFQLSAKVLFDVVFVLVYLVILLALFLALFVRVIVLWIYMMASPIFWLLYFSSKWAWKLWEKFNFKEFFALAMVPVYVSAALSFWLMFLLIIWEWGKQANFSAADWDRYQAAKAAAASADTEYDLWSTKLTILWAIGDDKNKKNFLSSVAWWALGALGYIMLKLFGLAFLWMAVMAALRSSKITHSVVEPIEKLWDQVWKFAMESPKFIPIPWTSWLNWGKNMSAWGLLWWIKQGMEMKMRWPANEANKFAQKFMWTEESRAITNELEKIRQETNPGKQIDLLKDLLVKSDEWNTFLQKSAIADQLALNPKVNKETIAAIRDSKNPEQFTKAISDANNQLQGTLLWKLWEITDEQKAKTIMWSGTWTSGSDASTKPANQTVNIDLHIDKANNNKVNTWVDFSWDNPIINDAEKYWNHLENFYGKSSLDANELVTKLRDTVWKDDKDKIILVIEKLGKEWYLSGWSDEDKKETNAKTKAETIVEKIIPETIK